MTDEARNGTTPGEQSGQSSTVAGNELDAFKEVMAEQRERQGRLRHVQQFLSSPLFFDLRDQPIDVSDPPEAIESRKRDIDYRIRVLQSILELLKEERAALDRTRTAESGSPDAAPKAPVQA